LVFDSRLQTPYSRLFSMKLKSHLSADAAIVLTTLIWGSTFAVARDMLDLWPPLSYLAIRMPLSALLFVAIFPRQVFGASRAALKAGATLGLLIGCAFVGQTTGLLWTTPAKSAFISGLTTPLIPVVAYLLYRARPSRENLAGIILASIGGALILAPAETQGVNTGDLLTLGTTLLFATHVSLMSVYARRFDIRQLSALQVVFAAALIFAAWLTVKTYAAIAGLESLPQGLARETAPLVWNARIIAQLAYMATIATVLVFLTWTWGQARMSATHAAVIFSLEPVFATMFAILIRGSAEWTGGRATIGAALIIVGVIVSELRWGVERRDEVGDDGDENQLSRGAD
jgi:drug/metabolite transporter (DMT)-like permease